MMKVYVFVCYALCSCLQSVFCEYGETCKTVDDGQGSCISVFECLPYQGYLQQTTTKPELVQILRKAHCGFEGINPKVCCPHTGIISSPQTTPTLPTANITSPLTTLSSRTVSEDLVQSLPEPPHCGDSRKSSIVRVVGGRYALLGDFPWMALLGYNNRRTGATMWACGGSLISSKHVLTAAHCIHNHEHELYVVRLGELDLSKEDEGATPIDFLIKKQLKHENYDPMVYTNDIGILVLEKEVQFTNLIKPICIPKESKLGARSLGGYPFIAGWGQTNFRGPSAPHLQNVQLPVVSNEDCAQAYRQYKSQVIDERTLCAGYPKGGKDACKGDSGGPLMEEMTTIINQTYKTYFYQIGVVSYGKGCAEAGFPGVYSRVTHFVPWIKNTVEAGGL